jgi:L-amino acid N-acyltransferase
MKVIDCSFHHAPEILAIFNEEIASSTGLYDYKPRTMSMMEAWFEAKTKGNYPVRGLVDEDGSLAGFASYGPFRPWPAYKYSVEHSVYVHKNKRGQGLGRRLVQEIIELAKSQEYHTVIGGIDSTNVASIRLHCSLGFSSCASIKQAGFKFGRWLDLELYQLILSTPFNPSDG